MKKIFAFILLMYWLTSISFAQKKKTQLSFNINLIDANVAAEFSLSANSTLYAAIGFGSGSVNSINLKKYYDRSRQHERSSDVTLPEIFFSPYLNLQYRNYFLREKENRKGYYTGNNSGMYVATRLKMYTAPVMAIKEDIKSIRQNYMLGLLIGYQKAVGTQRRFIINTNTGLSSHANYNLSFFQFKPMLHASVGYILK